MRYIVTVLLLIIFILPATSKAQQTSTLVNGEVNHGGFGSLLFGVTSINGGTAYLRGMRGAWTLKFRKGHSLNIGAGKYRTYLGFNSTGLTQPGTNNPELTTQYGGFELEYLNRTNNLVHFGLQTMIGSGTVQYRDRDIQREKRSDRYFAFQPGFNLHLNITPWFRFSTGLFYRYAGGVDLEGTDDKSLSGITGILGLRFGWF